MTTDPSYKSTEDDVCALPPFHFSGSHLRKYKKKKTFRATHTHMKINNGKLMGGGIRPHKRQTKTASSSQHDAVARRKSARLQAKGSPVRNLCEAPDFFFIQGNT